MDIVIKQVDRGNNEIWWSDSGERHREDGPAVSWANGDREWWVNGELHRINGPAITWSNGKEEWWYCGKRHREDGPAIKYPNGTEEWYINGKRHRVDGPAIKFSNEIQSFWNSAGGANNLEWWINGINYTFRDWLSELKSIGIIDDCQQIALILKYQD